MPSYIHFISWSHYLTFGILDSRNLRALVFISIIKPKTANKQQQSTKLMVQFKSSNSPSDVGMSQLVIGKSVWDQIQAFYFEVCHERKPCSMLLLHSQSCQSCQKSKKMKNRNRQTLLGKLSCVVWTFVGMVVRDRQYILLDSVLNNVPSH